MNGELFSLSTSHHHTNCFFFGDCGRVFGHSRMMISMIKLTTCIFLFISLSFTCDGQEGTQQTWREQLKPCEIDIPLYYATKNQAKLLESAEKYKGIELILVTIDKKKGPSYHSYYLERFESDFGPSAYLVKSEFLHQDRRPDHVIFLGYNPKKHIFYKADCFRENPASKNLYPQ